MTDSSNEQGFSQVNLRDFQECGINKIVEDENLLSLHQIRALINEPLAALAENETNGISSALRVIGAATTFYFNPANKLSPYGPMMQFEGKRSPIPDDFSPEIVNALAQFCNDVSNPAIRARLADVAWIRNRKLYEAAKTAVRAYNLCADKVFEGVAIYRSSEKPPLWRSLEFIQRALDIGRKIGWEKEEVAATKAILKKFREHGKSEKDHSLFLKAASLELLYGITDPSAIASEAETMAQEAENVEDTWSCRENWELAAQSYRAAKDTKKEAECLINSAETFVKDAERAAPSAFTCTHFLTSAIKRLREVPKQLRPSGRLEALQTQLITAQASINEEFNTFEYKQDLSEIVESIIPLFKDQRLSECLLRFAQLDRPKPYAAYRDDALKREQELPLSTLFGVSVHDQEGKVVYQTEGGSFGQSETEEALRHSIAQSMSFDYGLVVQSAIEPSRFIISQEHNVSRDLMAALVSLSGFVPRSHERIFALGFSYMFYGHHMEAACLLIPQLENSLRYILRQAGYDVSTILPNMTQEDISIAILLNRFRNELNSIFGEAMIFKIEMLFHDRAGPNLRNRLAHGTWTDGHFHTAEAVYACWQIFQLTCAPLFQDWATVEKVIVRFDS